MSAKAAPPLPTRLWSLIEPSFILYYAVKAYVTLALSHLLRGSVAPLTNASSLRDDAFSAFWSVLSPPPPNPAPDPSTLVGSAALVPPVLANVTGTALELGPGSGAAIPYLPTGPHLRAVYAAEPATGLHAALRKQADISGLGPRYRILNCTAEPRALAAALAAEGVALTGPAAAEGHALFDSIVCVRVLCSVPDPAAVVANLYALLRPGGSLFVVEHVVNQASSAGGVGGLRRGSIAARAMQAVYMALGWRFFVGDCELTRDTGALLRHAADVDAGWAAVEVDDHFAWAVLPYIAGRFVKKEKA